jgi:hypothetical protein
MSLRSHLLLPLLLLLVPACASSKTRDVRDRGAIDSDWIAPTPLLQQQIDDEAKRLPYSHGFDRLEQIRWFAALGEPAYATLLRLAEDPRDDVAAAALAAMGATLDARLVPHVRHLSWDDRRLLGDLGLERARTLVRLGDWSEMPLLIDGLEDPRLFTRSLCLDALREATHETHGYDPRAEEKARARSIERWRTWWGERSGEGILPRRR